MKMAKKPAKKMAKPLSPEVVDIWTDFNEYTKNKWSRPEQLKSQRVEKPKNGAISIGDVQIKDGKMFLVTDDNTYPLESLDELKKLVAKTLLKQSAVSSEDSEQAEEQYLKKSLVKMKKSSLNDGW